MAEAKKSDGTVKPLDTHITDAPLKDDTVKPLDTHITDEKA
ncbi:hypothetical protein ACIQFZ_14185 [Streptomyces sp. NPDC093064]